MEDDHTCENKAKLLRNIVYNVIISTAKLPISKDLTLER